MLLSAVCGLGIAPGTLEAQARLTQDEALALAFPPPATVERRTAFLTEAQVAAVQRLAGSDVAVTQRVVTYYVGRGGDSLLGVAYFDAHRVRTLNEVLMIVVLPDGAIAHIEVLLFAEPPEYRPPRGWLQRIEGRTLTDELSLRGAIVNMSGATLTARAVVEASRRTLAYHQVIRPLAGGGSR